MIVQLKILHTVARRRRLYYSHRSHRHAVVSLVVVSVSAALVSSNDAMIEKSEHRILDRRARPSTQICACEKHGPTTPPTSTVTEPTTSKPLSRLTLMLYASKLYPYSSLPVPRLLTPRDPLFSYPELKCGLVRRRNDEERVKEILSSTQLMEARKNQDQAQMQNMLKQMNCVVYGEGVSPQVRENFLMQYGCTGFTDEILQYLVQTFGHRGIIEVGAGNGQWARALSDHNELMQTQPDQKKIWNFILAYDNMEQLPLSPKVYHKNTLPANKYFFNAVKCASHIKAVQGSRGRVLLLVYPPPGRMALETVLAYLSASLGYSGSYKNDTVIYVGEGRGGANADDAFFDYLLGCGDAKEGQCQWVIEKIMNVKTCPGDKGYEKMFVFRRR